MERPDRSIYGQGATHGIVLNQLKPKLRRALRLALSMPGRFQEGTAAIRYIILAWDLAGLVILAYQIRSIILYTLPVPTKKNTTLANSHLLIDQCDRFFSFENNPDREQELRALWYLFILMYDYDMYYRERFDIVLRWLASLVIQGHWRSSDGRREPRRPWWRQGDPCPGCGQNQGTPRVFADCPAGMHID